MHSISGSNQALHKMPLTNAMPPLISEQDAEPGISENYLKEELDKIKNSLPTYVSNWNVAFKRDNSNDPAIYVHGTVDDDDVKDEKTRFGRRREIRTIVRDLIGEKINYRRFVYVHFHIPSDFEE